jgi:hypothetical protein
MRLCNCRMCYSRKKRWRENSTAKRDSRVRNTNKESACRDRERNKPTLPTHSRSRMVNKEKAVPL